MTEDDTKVIAYIRRFSGNKSPAKVLTFKAGLVTITIYDYGMESGDDRFYVEAQTAVKYQSTQGFEFRRLDDALEFISWEKL